MSKSKSGKENISKAVEKEKEQPDLLELPDFFDELPKSAKDLVGSLPEEKRKEALLLMFAQTKMSVTSFQGPIPHPTILKGYEDIIKGSAERMIKMAEEQASHRMGIEKEVIKSQINQTNRGQYFGLGIALFVLTLGVVLAIMGFPALSGILFTSTVVGLVAVFMRVFKKTES